MTKKRKDKGSKPSGNAKKRGPRKSSKPCTNRIREIRERLGLTADDLAKLVNSTEATISRLERGKLQLTEDWMRRIAKALKVEPADLLESATFVNMADEVEDAPTGASPSVMRAMNSQDLTVLRVVGHQVERLGVTDGYEGMFRISPEASASAKTGDVVLAQIRRRSDGKTARIVRQFVEPSTLVTNRKGRNVTIDLEEPRFDVEILGVLIRPN